METDPTLADPFEDAIEAIAESQIAEIVKSRSSDSLQQTHPEPAVEHPAAPEVAVELLRSYAGGFLTSGVVNPDTVKGEIIDDFGFVVPPQHEAAYTNHRQKTAAMHELWRERWIAWVETVPAHKFLNPTDAVLAMTRGGIPTQFRPSVWLVSTGANMIKEANPNLYAELVEAIDRDSQQGLMPQVYDQVAKDLYRSIPNNIYFRSANAHCFGALKRVLLAYALHNMSVGYCQGMNVLCSMLLLIMTEEDAFFMLKIIVERILPSYFGQGLSGLTTDMSIIEAMMEDRSSELIEHLNTIGMPMHVVTTRWLLCIFVNAMPSEGALRIWDCVLLEGRKALIKAVMALFEVLKPQLLSCPDCDTAFELLQSVAGRMWDASALVHLMNDTTPSGLFSKKPIGVYVTAERLQSFRNKVKQEELEQDRQQREPSSKSGMFSSVKNWTNKQVAKLQRMKKSANWLDDIVKLVQESGLALTHTPKTLAQALLYTDDPGSLLDPASEGSEEVESGLSRQMVLRSNSLIMYMYFKLTQEDTVASVQASVSQQISQSEVFHVNGTAAKWRPAYWMSFDHKSKQLVFVIRPAFPGMQLSDYIGPAVPFMNGFAHAGMVAGARWFASNVTELLKQGLQLHPGYKLVIVSHALGAGVGMLATLLLRREQPALDAEFHGFSTPACISEDSAYLCQSCVTSIILGHDCIPALCLRRLGNLASRVRAGSLLLSVEEEQQMESSMTESQLQPMLISAHESILLQRLRGKEGEIPELRAARIKHTECSSDGLALSPSMFSNHGLPAYFRTLQLLSETIQPLQDQPEEAACAEDDVTASVPSPAAEPDTPSNKTEKTERKRRPSGRA
eukprot:TRINITY_DN4360_c0_g1_i4.p1 TRINITY_DN4360_c0_g1~~TRINITY_DN4360_c0_g1_i4.p1  ORF type:complete len:848 (-),score=247.34 TRINITY_DN4360_c0_g1_i4:342-2885(-)